jgi:hypothetical protein
MNKLLHARTAQPANPAHLQNALMRLGINHPGACCRDDEMIDVGASRPTARHSTVVQRDKVFASELLDLRGDRPFATGTLRPHARACRLVGQCQQQTSQPWMRRSDRCLTTLAAPLELALSGRAGRRRGTRRQGNENVRRAVLRVRMTRHGDANHQQLKMRYAKTRYDVFTVPAG